MLIKSDLLEYRLDLSLLEFSNIESFCFHNCNQYRLLDLSLVLNIVLYLFCFIILYFEYCLILNIFNVLYQIIFDS